MKTRLEWFNTMPEPYKSQAIENEDPDKLNQEYDSLCSALDHGFDWEESPQGCRYWDEASQGKFPNAVKDELRVTKDRVLEAAERCSTTKEALKILFPEAFEDDKAVDLTGVGEINDKTGRSLIFPAYKRKGCFALDDRFNWALEWVDQDIYLIPTKK